MFTIKHILGNMELLYSGERVVFYSNSEDVALFSEKNLTLKEGLTIVDGDDKVLHELRHGRVYVMNANGSTVAKYEMSDLE